MKKIILSICLSCLCIISFAQTPLPTPVDSVHIFGGWRCKYIEAPIYIKNKNYVVYEYRNTRKIIYPDIESFRIPQNVSESGLAVDKKGIYYQGKFIKTDTTGIKIVGEKYDSKASVWLWKTKDKVFKNTKELSGVDPESFEAIECINGKYFKDKNYVYYFEKKIEGSDGSSVNKSCGEKCYDNNHLYINGKVVEYNGKKLQSVNNSLAKTDSEVINTSTLKPIPEIDAASLKKLSKEYSMDKNHVYYGIMKTPILRANLKNVKVWEQLNSAYVTDGLNVYRNDGQKGKSFDKELDAKTFGMLPYSDFIYDKNGIYNIRWENKNNISKIVLLKFPFNYTEPVTPENTCISDSRLYIIYCNQAYDPWHKELYTKLSKKEIEDIKTGVIMSKKERTDTIKSISLGYNYSKKGNNIYIDYVLLKTIKHPDSFTPLNYNYAKDNDNVYFISYEFKGGEDRYNATPIPNADLKTFEINILPYDKDFVYVGTEKLISSKNIEFLAIFSGYRPGCGMDRNPSTDYIFMKNIDGFWLIESLYSHDKVKDVQYLGKVYNPKWHEYFEDFKMPSK